MVAAIVLAALLAAIPAAIAGRKGRSAFGWWVFGTLMLIVALPAALLVKDLNAEYADILADELEVDDERRHQEMLAHLRAAWPAPSGMAR